MLARWWTRWTVLSVSLLGAILIVLPVAAQAPPAPPARFAGAVTINGSPAPSGTTIEARIGSTTCGTSSVGAGGAGNGRYVLDSPAVQTQAGCGTDGAVVTFWVGGNQAAQTGTWLSYQLNTLDLTVSTQAATPTAAPTQAPASPTPRPPTTGSGLASPDAATPWLFLGAMTVLMLGGVSFAAVATRRGK